MSGKRAHSLETPLCRFAFADGRRCRLPARPDYQGLCFQHGTFRPRASRSDNFLRELASVSQGSPRRIDVARVRRTLLRAVTEERISPGKYDMLTRLCDLMRRCQRYAHEEQFLCAKGPEWDDIRKRME